MKSVKSLAGRGLAWFAAGTAVFAAVLAMLPSPPDSGSFAPGSPQESFAIGNVTVFDGENFNHGWDVWVENGRIRQAGRQLVLPATLPRMEGSGHTLIPGLIDGHVHTFGATLNDALRFGVTTVLDQAAAPGLVASKRRAREDVGPATEADLFSAGMAATAPGGHGTQFGMPMETLTGPREAAEWVRSRKSEGSDWIKIIREEGGPAGSGFPSLDGDTVAALVAAAHAEGLIAVVHVSTLDHALQTLTAGADGLVHVWFDEVVSFPDARRFVEGDIFIVPLLSVMASADDVAVAELPREASEALLSPMQRQTLAERFPGELEGIKEVALENVRRLHVSGARLIAGTDAPNPGTGAGISMHGELRLLARAGLNSREILAAATSVAVDAFGVADRGRIEAGHLADLVLVRGDLEADVSASHDIIAIWKDGYLVNRGL